MYRFIQWLFFSFLIVIIMRASFAKTTGATKATPLKFMMITQREVDDPFWGIVENIAAAAAKELGIELYLRHAYSNRNNLLYFTNQAAEMNIDAIIYPNYKSIAPSLLELAEKRKIHTFLFNAGVSKKNKEVAGKPREHYKYWLGYSLPDDEYAGYLLANILIKEAKQKKLVDNKGQIQIVGITGTFSETPSLLRMEGLKRAVKEHPDVHLNQVVFSAWKKEIAKKQMKVLKKRYPYTTIYWAASDLIGIGISEGAKSLNLEPNIDILIGGIDWSVEGLNSVQSNQMVTTIGGHIFEGAWAVIMLFDYFNGVDFKNHIAEKNKNNYLSALDIIYPMEAFDKEKLSILHKNITENSWGNLDFKQYSIFKNPDRKYYDFFAGNLFLSH